MQPEQRRHRGFIGRRLAAIYYWLDLYGPDGRPSHTKVLSTWGFFLALAMEVWWVVRLSFQEDLENLADVITWPFVFLVVITLALAMGRDTFKAALRMRNGSGSGTSVRPRREPRTMAEEDR